MLQVKATKLPIEIDAVLWDGTDKVLDELMYWAKKSPTQVFINNNGDCLIGTLEGEMEVNEGDWIIKGIDNELYPCKPNIFDKTYKITLYMHS